MKKTMTKQSFEVARLAGGVLLRTSKPEKAREVWLEEAEATPAERVYLWTWSGSRRVREQVAN